MLGASTAAATASTSTSHISEILRLIESGISRSARSTSASGWMPTWRSAATECWVGLVFSSPLGGEVGHEGDVEEEHAVAAQVVAHLAGGLEERQRLDVADGAADLGDDDVGRVGVVDPRGAGGLRAHPQLELVGDVRDHLHRVAEVLAASLPGDHPVVDLAGRDVGAALEVDVEEALVVTDVEVGLGAVVGDEDLAVLEGVHRARVDVEVGVELLHRHPQPARPEEVSEGGGREPLAQRGGDSPGHEDLFRRLKHHGLQRYVIAARTPTRHGRDSPVPIPRTGVQAPDAAGQHRAVGREGRLQGVRLGRQVGRALDRLRAQVVADATERDDVADRPRERDRVCGWHEQGGIADDGRGAADVGGHDRRARVQCLLDADRLALPDRARTTTSAAASRSGTSSRCPSRRTGSRSASMRAWSGARSGPSPATTVTRSRSSPRSSPSASSRRSSPFCGASRATTTASEVRGSTTEVGVHGIPVARGARGAGARPPRRGRCGGRRAGASAPRGRPRRRARGCCAAPRPVRARRRRHR